MKLFVAICLSLFNLSPVFADTDAPVKSVGHLRAVKLIEITSITKTGEHVDTDAIKSYLNVEVSGVYEGHPAYDNVVGQLEPTRSGGMQTYAELKLYSVDLKSEPLKVGGGFFTAISRPTPFTVKIHIAPQGWDPSGNMFFAGPQVGAWWTISATARKYQPVQYEHAYGFTAILGHSADRKSWSFNTFGLKNNNR